MTDLDRAREIRARVDAMHPRVTEDGLVNVQHVAVESTLRERAALPSYIAELDGPGRYLLVAGGSPLARALARQLDDPEVRDRIQRQLAEFAERVAELLAVLRPQVEAALVRAGEVYGQLRSAGVLPEAPPEDPRARALWLRRHRSPGPDREPAGRQRRPRRHPRP